FASSPHRPLGLFFFFSSRRRHTRFSRDWSSDVCSSDLIPPAVVVMITLQPGESLKRHKTPVDVIFYVLEGTGTVEIGEEQATVGKDTLIESPARIPHRWINESGEVFRVLVIKVPKPTEETKLL